MIKKFSEAFQQLSPRQQRLSWSLILVLLYFVFAFIKMSYFLKTGRIWAEEGKFTFPAIYHEGWKGIFTYLIFGRLELIANAIAYLATLINFKFAPLVLTYVTLALQFLPIGFVIFYRERLGLKPWQTACLLLLAAGLPQSLEVWANTANVHFHFSFLAAVILILPLLPQDPVWLFRGLLLLCGLSGIPSNFLVPLFWWKAWKTKNKEILIQSLILSGTAVLQFFFMVTHAQAVEGRHLAIEPGIIIFSMISQQFIGPVSGPFLGKKVLLGLREIFITHQGYFMILGLSLYILGSLYSYAAKDKQLLSILAVAASFVLVTVSILGALGDKVAMISYAGGGRYFYIPNILLALALLRQVQKNSSWAVKGLLMLLLLHAGIGLVPRKMGLPWPEAYAKAVQSNSDMVEIWPDGWQMSNPSKDLSVGR